MSGIHGNPRRLWKPPGRSPYVRLRHMDFLRYSGGGCKMRTKPPSIRHPGSFRAFRDIRVPEFLDIGRNIRKSHMPAQDSFGGLPGGWLIYVSRLLKASIYARSWHSGSRFSRNRQNLSGGNSPSALR